MTGKLASFFVGVSLALFAVGAAAWRGLPWRR